MDAPPSDHPGPHEPVLDEPYLADLRGWVGETVLADLLAGAPHSFRPVMADLTANWRADARADMREAAHRLAGGAGSIGARRLADLARRCQRMVRLESGRIISDQRSRAMAPA